MDEAELATQREDSVDTGGVVFEDQETGEKIILLLRAHFITLIPSLFLVIFLILVPFLVLGLPLLSFVRQDLSSFLSGSQIGMLFAFWYLVTFGFAFYKFIFWYFNVYILTNERIIDVNFNGILSKDVAHAKLSRIQDVSPRVVGFFETFFNFGTVFIQTAGEQAEFHFENVPRPDIVTKEILDQARKHDGSDGLGGENDF